MTDTSELVAMVEDIKEQEEAKQQRREDIAEIKQMMRRLAIANGGEPDSVSQNGHGQGNWLSDTLRGD